MSVLTSSIVAASDKFRSNADKMQSLRRAIAEQGQRIKAGGSIEARQRHTSRGKLLPRERVSTLLDPGSPFLEIGLFAAQDV